MITVYKVRWIPLVWTNNLKFLPKPLAPNTAKLYNTKYAMHLLICKAISYGLTQPRNLGIQLLSGVNKTYKSLT